MACGRGAQKDIQGREHNDVREDGRAEPEVGGGVLPFAQAHIRLALGQCRCAVAGCAKHRRTYLDRDDPPLLP